MGLIAKVPHKTLEGRTIEIGTSSVFMKDDTELHASFFPPEWWPQSGVQLTWPHLATDWKDVMPEVTECYVKMAYEISSSEILLIVSPEPQEVERLLQERLPKKALRNIRYFQCPTNDTWARDHGFITVITDKKPELLDFQFNGWGKKFAADLDNAINKQLFDHNVVKGTYKDCLHFVLEGGSLESDGRGTLMTTTHCLLTKERNPQWNKAEIEEKLKDLLHVQRVVWLDHGHLEGDDTDGHIDTLARFCPNDTIVYTQCTDTQDAHYEELHLMEEQLKALRTLEGKPYTLIPVPLPDAMVADGERLPSTYANFLIMNDKLLFPTYNQPVKDEKARKALEKAFPKYEICGIDCCVLVLQHGSLHCSTMQFPSGILK